MIDFFKILIEFFQKMKIDYMLSGSVAMSIYILPRATRDFDFIVHLQPGDVDSIVSYFKKGYYCDADSVAEAVKRKGMFNIIDHSSGYKADFVVLKNSTFRQAEFNRRVKVDFLEMAVYVVRPEDLMLSKLIWIQQIQSNIQIEDIKNLSKIENLNWEYIRNWVTVLNLNTFNLFEKK